MRINGVVWGGLFLGAFILVLSVATSGDDTLLVQARLPVPPDSSSGIVAPAQPGGPVIVALEIDGLPFGVFSSLSGLGSENEIREKIVGTGVETSPGRLHWDAIVLSRGLTSNLDVYDWRQLVVDGQIAQARKDISVVLYDASATEIARFNVMSAFPCRYEIGPISPESTIAVETVQLCHNGFTRE